MNNEITDMLVARAESAREKSYCPYSSFAVGAALLTEDGEVYTGSNIENAAFTPTVCAERVAISSAVHSGKRNFIAIAVVGGRHGEPISSITPPCGVCRQVMAEFCRPDFKIILSDGKKRVIYTLEELMPLGFNGASLA